MAQRRMFSPSIVGSDAFLEMPTSSRELYFQLGMYADDDGFISPRKIMRMVGSSDDDLKMLIAKRFVLPFESGVVVVKHWRINNLIRKDWYRPSQYLEEKSLLYLKENGAYTFDKNQGKPSHILLVNEPLPNRQHRIGKDSIGNTTYAPAVRVKVPRETKPEEPFVWHTYLTTMENDSRKSVQLIAFYFKRRGVAFDTKAEVQVAIKRHLRAANEVVKFSEAKVLKAFEQCERKHADVDWTLETVAKVLTK